MIYDTIWYINIKTIQYEPVLIKYIVTDTVKYIQALKKEKSLIVHLYLFPVFVWI